MQPTTSSAATSGRSVMNSVKIGTRIFGGFTVVLALLVVVATIGVIGLTQADAGFSRLISIVDNTVRVLEIDRNVTSLRRNVALYTASRDDVALKRVEELKKVLSDGIAATEKATTSDERRKLLDETRTL